jgi:hypothetical protein
MKPASPASFVSDFSNNRCGLGRLNAMAVNGEERTEVDLIGPSSSGSGPESERH